MKTTCLKHFPAFHVAFLSWIYIYIVNQVHCLEFGDAIARDYRLVLHLHLTFSSTFIFTSLTTFISPRYLCNLLEKHAKCESNAPQFSPLYKAVYCLFPWLFITFVSKLSSTLLTCYFLTNIFDFHCHFGILVFCGASSLLYTSLNSCFSVELDWYLFMFLICFCPLNKCILHCVSWIAYKNDSFLIFSDCLLKLCRGG